MHTHTSHTFTCFEYPCVFLVWLLCMSFTHLTLAQLTYRLSVIWCLEKRSFFSYRGRYRCVYHRWCTCMHRGQVRCNRCSIMLCIPRRVHHASRAVPIALILSACTLCVPRLGHLIHTAVCIAVIATFGFSIAKTTPLHFGASINMLLSLLKQPRTHILCFLKARKWLAR